MPSDKPRKTLISASFSHLLDGGKPRRFLSIQSGTKSFEHHQDGTSLVLRRPTMLAYNHRMQRKIFWMIFVLLGLLADFLLPFWWAFAATVPILFFSWWVAYRSDWF
jgi:hypothetical protein